MQHTMNITAAALAVMLLAATSAYAGDTPSKINQRLGIGDPDTPSQINQRSGSGDPVAGKEKSAFCQGCHGEDGNSVSGVFPKLSGQWSDYIQKQLREFQNGARVNETMTDMATSVTEFQDVFDIAAYFASQKQMVSTVIDEEDEATIKLYQEGQKLYTQGSAENGAFRCVKCHGEHGSGQPLNNNLFPVLGGQHKDYLVKQLTEFKHEVRENDRSGMMLRITTNLTDHDIEAIATYLSSALPPPPVWETVLDDVKIRIEGTSFDVNSAKLRSVAFKQLNGVVKFAKHRPEMNLEVAGYTDNSGSEEKNIELSMARAESVKSYLVNKGVAADRIRTLGLGPADPVADNSTIEGRVQNRRIEVRSVHKEERKVRVYQ